MYRGSLLLYSGESPEITGREILRDNFDALFAKYPLLLAFGEDVGKIGGVNQTYEGLQIEIWKSPDF